MVSPSLDMRTTKTIRLRTAPSWLADKFRERPERIRIRWRPSAGEKRFLKRKKIEPPSVWAPKNRVVTYGPLKGSRWDPAFMPHMNGIIDTLEFPSVRFAGNCKSPQTGSSAGAETWLGYRGDIRPADALIVYPDRETTRKRSTDYLQPMFTQSPRLRQLLTGAEDDMASLRLKLQTMLVYMGWSGSVTSIGNISAAILVGDEIDKWQLQPSKKEAKSLLLFYERFLSYEFGGKCFLISTPSDIQGPIWLYMVKEAQVVFVYCIPCPECGEFHRSSDRFVDFGGERDPQVVEHGDVAKYVFPCCGLIADDRVRGKALERGVWYALENSQRDGDGALDMEIASQNWQVPGRERTRYLREEKPEKVCFHSPGIVSKLVKHRKIAVAFLKGLADPSEMHYYDNQIKAVAHVPFRQNRKEDAILRLRDDRPKGLVPGGNRVAALTAGVDTQDNSFVYVIRAWGWGMTQPSWKIDAGEVTSEEALIKVLFENQYTDASGLYYPLLVVVIDSGGHRTSEVYDLCRRYPGRMIAYKGSSGRKNKPWSKTVIDTYPGTRTPIPGGVELYVCDHHYYKDILAAKLRVASDAPGAMLMHSETTMEYASQMCAEYVDDRRLWQCPKNKANHYWDCEVMALIGADLARIKYNPDPNGDQGEHEDEQVEESTDA